MAADFARPGTGRAVHRVPRLGTAAPSRRVGAGPHRHGHAARRRAGYRRRDHRVLEAARRDHHLVPPVPGHRHDRSELMRTHRRLPFRAPPARRRHHRNDGRHPDRDGRAARRLQRARLRRRLQAHGGGCVGRPGHRPVRAVRAGARTRERGQRRRVRARGSRHVQQRLAPEADSGADHRWRRAEYARQPHHALQQRATRRQSGVVLGGSADRFDVVPDPEPERLLQPGLGRGHRPREQLHAAPAQWSPGRVLGQSRLAGSRHGPVRRRRPRLPSRPGRPAS